MTIVLTMIDEASTPAEFKRCCILVRDHITSNIDPDLNGVLVNVLMLRCVILTASYGGLSRMRDAHVLHEIRGMAKEVMTTYHTNPPVQRTEA